MTWRCNRKFVLHEASKRWIPTHFIFCTVLEEHNSLRNVHTDTQNACWEIQITNGLVIIIPTCTKKSWKSGDNAGQVEQAVLFKEGLSLRLLIKASSQFLDIYWWSQLTAPGLKNELVSHISAYYLSKLALWSCEPQKTRQRRSTICRSWYWPRSVELVESAGLIWVVIKASLAICFAHSL